MKEIIVKRLGALLSVKSLVTLLLSGVFAYLAITGQTSQEFMTVYTSLSRSISAHRRRKSATR